MAKYKLNVISFLAILIVICTSVKAQDTGIAFKHDSWAVIVAKAKAENKYIFVDCFTTWCGPCKYMNTNIYPLKEVGDFYNDKFISVQFQLDTTATDSKNIKLQYADAAFIKNEYKINAYPTYLFFNKEGELVQIEGGSSKADDFIVKGKNALNPDKQYLTQTKKYNGGCREEIFLKNLTILAKHAFDDLAASKYAKEYLLTQTNLLNKNNMQFIFENTHSISDTGFALMLGNMKQFNSVINTKELLEALKLIVMQSAFSDTNINVNMTTKQWNEYSIKTRRLYPEFCEDIIVEIKTIFFGLKGKWLEYAKAAEEYSNSKSTSPEELNKYAWKIFEKCNDKKILGMAILWSKKSFTNQLKIDPGFMDTYANLLYKIGDSKDAMVWQKKAQTLAIKGGANKNWGQDVIDKINKGVKTW